MRMCNAEILITHAFHSVGANANSVPEFIRIEIRDSPSQNRVEELLLPVSELSAKALKRMCPLLRFDGNNKTADNMLMAQLQEGLLTGEIAKGYSLHEVGAIRFPDGSLRFLRGNELYPEFSTDSYTVPSEMTGIRLAQAPKALAVDTFANCLLTAPTQALLTLAFVLLTSVRSLVLDEGVNLQAVLYIVGGQGLGKTTLATRVAGIYRNERNRPAALVQAGSTKAAIENLLVMHRDQPVIVDDLCLSAGRDVERKRRELGAHLIRLGSGDIPIIKKKGSGSSGFDCQAGVILTAEFPLKNLSDLTRCLIVPVKKRLNLPDSLTPESVGGIVRHYSRWFASHGDEELALLHESLLEPWKIDLEPRVRTNYGCLRWAFRSFIKSLADTGLDGYNQKILFDRMEQALIEALDEHERLRQRLLGEIKQGNLAAVIYSGYQNGCFQLKNSEKKWERSDGCIWGGDLCLLPESLCSFIRGQPGYHMYTKHRISRELKDIRALVIQEDSASTVHLEHNKPRVYRIRLDALEDAAEYY